LLHRMPPQCASAKEWVGTARRARPLRGCGAEAPLAVRRTGSAAGTAVAVPAPRLCKCQRGRSWPARPRLALSGLPCSDAVVDARGCACCLSSRKALSGRAFLRGFPQRSWPGLGEGWATGPRTRPRLSGAQAALAAEGLPPRDASRGDARRSDFPIGVNLGLGSGICHPSLPRACVRSYSIAREFEACLGPVVLLCSRSAEPWRCCQARRAGGHRRALCLGAFPGPVKLD
jgi:hypothetical protein